MIDLLVESYWQKKIDLILKECLKILELKGVRFVIHDRRKF